MTDNNNDEEDLGERWAKFKADNWERTNYSSKFQVRQAVVNIIMRRICTPRCWLDACGLAGASGPLVMCTTEVEQSSLSRYFTDEHLVNRLEVLNYEHIVSPVRNI